jgi:magnesium-protoporphyrin IX monomethyl ester (oxidative) cyclase
MNVHSPVKEGTPVTSDVKARAPINETTRMAQETTLLDPRFYTTDFDKLDAVDVTLVREEWDALIQEMRDDPTRAISSATRTGMRSTLMRLAQS